MAPMAYVGLVGLLLWGAMEAEAGRVVQVRNPSDGHGPGFSCPGATCTLREAWENAVVNDTIELTVNPTLTMGELSTPTNCAGNGAIYITASPALGRAVLRTGAGSQTRVFSLTNWPYYAAHDLLTLDIKNVEFVDTFSEGGFAGGVICVSDDEFCGNPNTNPSMHTKAESVPPRKAGLRVEGEPAPVDWVSIANAPVLRLTNCVFRNNTIAATGNYNSVITTYNHDGDAFSPWSTVVSKCTFVDNLMTGSSPIGSVITSLALEGTAPLMVSDSRFIGNLQMTHAASSGRFEGYDGPIIGVIGPITISGSSFVGNTLGASRAIVSTSPAFNPYPVVIERTTMIRNGPNAVKTMDYSGAIIGGTIELKEVILTLPETSPTTATLSRSAQSLTNCAISSESPKAVLFNVTGTVLDITIYNINPAFLNLTVGPGASFAGCSALGWTPCMQGTKCQAVDSPAGLPCGVVCS